MAGMEGRCKNDRVVVDVVDDVDVEVANEEEKGENRMEEDGGGV